VYGRPSGNSTGNAVAALLVTGGTFAANAAWPTMMKRTLQTTLRIFMTTLLAVPSRAQDSC
jgi:hypothetical protein